MGVAATDAKVSTSFGSWIVAATVGPWLGAGLLGRNVGIAQALAMVGAMHVGTTALTYADSDARHLIAADMSRYVWLPLGLLAAGITAALWLPASALAALVLARLGWQTHHFNRQNLGMLGMWARATGRTGLAPRDRDMIDLIGVSAVLVIVALGLPTIHPTLNASWISLGMVVAASATAIVAVCRARSLRVGLTALYWAPLVVWFGQPATALLMIGSAHAAQYWLMMTGPARHRSDHRMALSLLLAGVGVGGAYWFGSRADAGVLYGLFLGAGASHFLIDAGLWRMRDPLVRAYWANRFRFL